MSSPSTIRRYIESLGPYPSLLLLALPVATVEPLKLLGVFVFGNGHWITGSFVVVGAYAFSLLVIERLFKIVKPKLLKLPWFATTWNWFVAARDGALSWLRTNARRESALPPPARRPRSR